MGLEWQVIENELVARGRSAQWLADQLGMPIQRVHNWKSRGVPAAQHAAVAHVLGWTVDRLTGGGGRGEGVVLVADELELMLNFRRLTSSEGRAQVLAYVQGLLAAGGAPKLSRATSRPREEPAPVLEDTASIVRAAEQNLAHQLAQGKKKAGKTVPTASAPASSRPKPRHPQTR